MTWYRYTNYGTSLQSTALFYSISKLGYDCSFINYRPQKRYYSKEEVFNIRIFWQKIIEHTINRAINDEPMKRKFDAFIDSRTKETIAAQNFPELEDLSNSFDAIVCGSDQIWSPVCFDDKYFLPFVNTNKKVAYAPSIGSSEIRNKEIEKKMKDLISSFNYLSIRETRGAELIKQMTDQNAKVVLDPTMLLTPEEWTQYAKISECETIRTPYIVCYFLGDESRYKSFVKSLSSQLSLPVYIIPVTNKQKVLKSAVPFHVGPAEFVSLIRNANYICTDSYHGMIFAILFHKCFSVFKRFKDSEEKDQNSRIYSLLNMLGLEERLVDSDKERPKIVANLDYTNVDKILQEKRTESKEYLESSLKLAIENKPAKTDYTICAYCCGCGACTTVCNQKAISIKRDEYGFWHYLIDEDKCIKCGACKQVCPNFNIIASDMQNSYSLYAFKSASNKVLKRSSSGGAGYELAKYLNNNGYVVYGCEYCINQNMARHIKIEPNDGGELGRLQGSKYIQSYSVSAINDLANENRQIAFFGTPCQNAAVDKILKKKGKRENAVLIDLICHGVPSSFLWDKYIKDRNQKYHTGEHPKVEFRNKEYSWWRRLLLLLSQDEKYQYTCDEKKDDFYAFFRRPLCYMESCFECPYRERSAADIRIGDYWGPKYKHDKTGVSMVISNSDVGESIIHILSDNGCLAEKTSLQQYWDVQYPFNPQKPLFYNQLISDLKTEETSLKYLRKQYCNDFDKFEFFSNIYASVKNMRK